jgi:ADP-ribosylglycohydrolase
MDILSGLGETGAEVLHALQQAKDLGENGTGWLNAYNRLGNGWVAEEILAISVYLGLTAPDFLTGIRWAANHPGDADSVGAISGQLLGAIWGIQAIPEDWIERLEGKEAINLLVSQFLSGTKW